MWWNSSEGSLKYFSDGDSNQWVDASPGGVITGGTEGGASVTTSDAHPSNAADGDLWWQSDVGVLKYIMMMVTHNNGLMHPQVELVLYHHQFYMLM